MARSTSLAILFAVVAALWTSSAVACEADVRDEAMCDYFAVYRPEGTPTNPRILDRMGLKGKTESVRSYALIVDVNHYPNFPEDDRDLLPAKNDLKNLTAFFREQEFDEVIVLENEVATPETISYFLEEYLLNASAAHSRMTRIVFAYSGHGADGANPGAPGSIVLSNAYSGRDPAGTIKLNKLQVMLSNLAEESFHLLALMGSCYSGGIFSVSGGGGDNMFFSKAPGAHAISATSADELAYGLSAEEGSIFFDQFIRGINSGWADPTYAGHFSDANGMTVTGGGIVRLAAAAGYVSGFLDNTPNPSTGGPFPQVLLGGIRAGNAGGGAFFFLVPFGDSLITADLGLPPDAPVLMGESLDTGSAVRDRPDIKVFNSPDTYQVFGIDVSHHSDVRDWEEVKETGVSFAYIKATEGKTFKDPEFRGNWDGAASVGIAPGAYHVFHFCRDAESQFENIRSVVPDDPDGLPIAIDLEWVDGPSIPSQQTCDDIGKARSTLRELLRLIQDEYGKAPIVYAHSGGVKELLGGEFDDYALWLQNWHKGGEGPTLSGRNPWTIWQYSGDGDIPGATNIDLNAFFGTEDEFASFALGLGNVALQAALN